MFQPLVLTYALVWMTANVINACFWLNLQNVSFQRLMVYGIICLWL